MPMNVDIVTPENVLIQFSVAGLSSRAFAFIYDMFIQGIMIFALSLAMYPVYQIFGYYSNAGSAIFIAGMNIIVWGYHIFFETFRNGQTPGKKQQKIKVVTLNGQPIDFFQSASRNLLRIIDFLPACFSTGIVTIFLNQKCQRVGDIISGTLVIRETRFSLRHMKED